MSQTIPRLQAVGLHSPLAGPYDLTIGAVPVAITGPSGAGKSLLLRMVADLDPHRGQAWLDGVARSQMSAPAWRRRVVYVAAESGWWSADVMAHFTAEARAEAAARAAAIGLPDGIFSAQVQRLSSGERQRLALLRALAVHPKVLLLDEPTRALDQETTLRVEALLQERIAGGLAVLLVTHDPGQAARIGARHFRLQNRNLVAA